MSNYFTLLQLPKSFTIDLVQLEKNYLKQQQAVHPDRHISSDAAARLAAAQQSSIVNEAYQTLKSDLKRAEYLLKIKQGVAANAHTISDPELLMESMEMREELAECLTTEALAAFAAKAGKQREAAVQEIGVAFENQHFEVAERLILRLKYLTKLADEIRLKRVALSA